MAGATRRTRFRHDRTTHRRGARHASRISCASSCVVDAIPFDSLLADASRESRTHSLDAIRLPKIEAATFTPKTTPPSKRGKRHGEEASSRKDRSMDRRLGEEESIYRAAFSAPPTGTALPCDRPRHHAEVVHRRRRGRHPGGREAAARVTRGTARCPPCQAPAREWTVTETGRRDTGSAPSATPPPDCDRGRRAISTGAARHQRNTIIGQTKDLTS
jgi:hypothetical protein